MSALARNTNISFAPELGIQEVFHEAGPMAGMAHLLSHLLFGPPRNILILILLKVGDDPWEQFWVALAISVLLAVIAAVIYIWLSDSLCGKRSVAGERVAHKRWHEWRVADGNHENEQPNPQERDPSTLWTIHNKRYDLRDFVEQHPGGVDAISLGQGFNCTELFESYHGLAKERFVRATLKKYYVEDACPGAADYDDHFDWSSTPFYDTLKQRVREHFRQKKCSYRAPPNQWAQLVGFCVLSAASLYYFMHGNFLAMLLLPFVYWWGPSPCMHDGGHFALAKRPWLNRVVGHIGGAHMSLFSWYHQHTVGHHCDTSIPGRDPDLYHFAIHADKGMPGFRTSVELRTLPEFSERMQKREAQNGKPTEILKRESYWRSGFLLRVPFSTLGPTLLWDIQSLAIPELDQAFLGLVPYRSRWMQGLAIHSIGRVLVIWLAFIHPITICLVTASGWGTGLLSAACFAIFPYAIHGCIFYAFSQVSHVQEECSQHKIGPAEHSAWSHRHPTSKRMNDRPPRETPKNAEDIINEESGRVKPKEWAIHQVEHALDYAIDSKFWLHVSNGLNLQVVHHLFPQVGWGHYTELAPIIQEVCSEFGVKYATKPSFFSALSSHYDYLKHINDEPNGSVWIKPSPGRASPDALWVLDQVDSSRDSWEKAA